MLQCNKFNLKSKKKPNKFYLLFYVSPTVIGHKYSLYFLCDKILTWTNTANKSVTIVNHCKNYWLSTSFVLFREREFKDHSSRICFLFFMKVHSRSCLTQRHVNPCGCVSAAFVSRFATSDWNFIFEAQVVKSKVILSFFFYLFKGVGVCLV